MTGTPKNASLSVLAATPSTLAMRFAGIPPKKEVAPAPERQPPASVEAAETAFRHATIKYNSLHEELLSKLRAGSAQPETTESGDTAATDGTAAASTTEAAAEAPAETPAASAISPEELQPMVIAIREAETACYEALHDWSKMHPHGKQLMKYCALGSAFASHVAALVAVNINPLDPGYRRPTKDAFDQWKYAELEFAGLGYKTVSLEDFFFSLPVEGTLHKAIYPQLLVKLQPGETRVLHALEYQRKEPKLQLAGGKGAMSRNNKKKT